MITLKNLTYRYPDGFEALSGITADIPSGIYLLLGENGAGKTTLLHVIAGLRKAVPAEACEIDGQYPALRRPSLMSRLFILTDDMQFPFPTINDMVVRHACLYPTFDADMLRENLANFGMTGNEPLHKFSMGNRKKAQLAYILALRADVLLLDEPANGLDITAKQALLQMLARCVSPEQTVIISTHTVWDFQNLFDGVIMLRRGRLLLSQHIWEVTEKVAFVSDTMPVDNALYMEHVMGRFNAVVPNDGSINTDIDYLLLYNALQRSENDKLLNVLTNSEK